MKNVLSTCPFIFGNERTWGVVWEQGRFIRRKLNLNDWKCEWGDHKAGENVLFLAACPSLWKRRSPFGEVFRNTLVSLCVVRGAGIAVVRFGQLRVNYNTGLGTGMSCRLMRCSPSSHSIFWALNLSSVQVIEGILVLMKNWVVVPSPWW